MDKEIIVRRFTEKRRRYRKLSFLSTIVFMIFILFADKLFPLGSYGAGGGLYTKIVTVWVIFEIALSHYIGYYLSICPICHIVIPTLTPRRGRNRGKKVMGNGSLPYECPFCGTIFDSRD